MSHLGRFLAAAALVFASMMTASAAVAADCGASVITRWLDRFDVTATASGPCGRADLALSITQEGRPVHEASFSQPDVFGFDDVGTADRMTEALKEWLVYSTPAAAQEILPPWREGANAPEDREFPFFPDEFLSPDVYRAAYAQNWTVICYIQGRESFYCLGEEPQSRNLIGLGFQLFPG